MSTTLEGGPSLAERVAGSPALRRRQAAAAALVKSLGRIDVHGAGNVPADGPVVLAANHRAFLDGPLLFGLVQRPVNFLVKVEAFTPLAAGVLRSTGQIPLVRERYDPGAVRQCLRILRARGVVGVFPEGSRGDGSARAAKPGVGYFALRTGALVLPVAVHGSERLGRHVRPHVRVTFGAPVRMSAVGDGQRVTRRAAAQAAEQIRAGLALLVASSAPRGVAGAAA